MMGIVSENGRTDIPSLLDLLLEMPQRRTMEGLLRLVVDRLTQLPEIALARIWLMLPGDICEACPMRSECPDQTSCLHLASSAGRSNHGHDWTRTDGLFQRFPLGVLKVGRIGRSGSPIVIPNIARDATWIARPDWAESEQIRGFCGQPLVFRGDTLGVVGVFTRRTIDQDWADWLRVITDHVASAVVNARAFEEIAELKERLELDNSYLMEEVTSSQAFGEIVGASPAIQQVERQIELVAPSEASVVISGASGTGKELAAREIHRRSARAERPLIKVNCASIPRELYESEFFGHVKGAFTGATRDRAGRFEAADGGTLFLDEVGEIPLDLQAKLLRVLQEGEYERIGDERTRQVDVRVLAASNRDLLAEVESGRFRSDLYYRLNVFPIEMPPLRERPDDIPLLAAHFLAHTSRIPGAPDHRLTSANLRALKRYDWPGNVRELKNVIERAVIQAGTGRLRLEPLLRSIATTADSSSVDETQILTESEMEQLQRQNTLRALEKTRWKIYGEGGAAELLGLKPTTLASRVRKFGLTLDQI